MMSILKAAMVGGIVAVVFWPLTDATSGASRGICD